MASPRPTSKKTRPNLTVPARERLEDIEATTGRIHDVLGRIEGVARDLVVNASRNALTPDEAFWLARSTVQADAAKSAASGLQSSLIFSRVGAAAPPRPNPQPRTRSNLSNQEYDEVQEALKLWGRAEKLETVARAKLDVLSAKHPTYFEPLARRNPGRSAGHSLKEFDREALDQGRRTEMAEHGLSPAVAARIAADHLTEDPNYYRGRSNPTREAARALDDEFSGATAHERSAVRRTLHVLATQLDGARSNPGGVAALALALPNPAGPHAVPYDGSHSMAGSLKNPARVLAGKMAWARKHPSEKAAAVARLQSGGGARDNISRPRWEILNSMGMVRPGAVTQFGGIPPFLTPKQQEAFAKAAAWQYRPVTPPKGKPKKAAKELTAAEKEKRSVAAKKREENLTKAVERMEKTLARGGVSGDALKAATQAYKAAKEQEIAAYKEGMRLGASTSMYARSPGSHPEDADIKGYLARVEALLAAKKAKKKSAGGGAKGLGLISAAAKKKDPVAWAEAQAKYLAAGKSPAAKAVYQSEVEQIAAKANPGGISGFKGWAKTAGWGLGAFVGASALSGLIDRVTSGSMPTITRFAVPAALGAATWYFGKNWAPEMRYGVLGGLVAAALFKPLLLGLLSKIPLIGGIFANMAGGAAPAAGQSGVGDLYDEAFGVHGYVLGDDDDDDEGMDGYVLGDDDDDEGIDGFEEAVAGTGAYVLGDDDEDDDGDAMSGYVLGDDDDDDEGMDGFEEAVAGVVDDAPYDEEDLNGFEEAVAGDDEVDEDLEEAEAMNGMGDAEVRRQLHPAGWKAIAAKFGKSVAYMKRNFKVLTMTPASARNIVQAGRGKVVGRSKRHRGMLLVLFRMRRAQQPRGPKERGGQVVRNVTARRPRDIRITRPAGGAIQPGGIFSTSVFGTNPQYTQQSR